MCLSTNYRSIDFHLSITAPLFAYSEHSEIFIWFSLQFILNDSNKAAKDLNPSARILILNSMRVYNFALYL